MKLHGKILFSWNENQLTIECEGPFNSDCLVYYGSKIQESVINRGCNNWQRLEIWDDNSLVTPEGQLSSSAFWYWCNENGCSLTAIVVVNALHVNLLKDHLRNNFKVFRDN